MDKEIDTNQENNAEQAQDGLDHAKAIEMMLQILDLEESNTRLDSMKYEDQIIKEIKNIIFRGI